MALQVWLSLNGNLNNNGLSDVTVTNNGATVNDSGKIGECYYFNGSSYIAVDTDFSNYSTTSCSLSCWVKPPTASSGNKQILAIGTSSGWGNIRFGILYRTNDAKMLVSISNGNEYVAYNCPGEIIENSWNHVAAVYNNHLLSLYINGELAKTYTTDYDISFSGITKFGIGAASDGAEKFTGYINDVRIYDHALSPREVKEISKGLVLHYPLSMPGGENLLKNSLTNFPQLWDGSGDGRTLTTQSGVSVPEWGCNDGLRVYGKSGATNALCLLINGITHGLTVSGTSVSGQKYTPSIYIKNNHQNAIYIAFNGLGTGQTINQGEIKKVILKATGNGHSYLQFTISASGVNKEYDFTFWHPKIELGKVCTPWVPATTDSLYSAMGFNDGIEYDVSGYRHNGTKTGAFAYDADTPRYNTSTRFNLTDTRITPPIIFQSGVKIPEISFSFWMKRNDYTDAKAHFIYNDICQIYTYSDYLLRISWKHDTESSSKGNTSAGSSATTTTTPNEWHHICYTFDKGYLRLYRDGEFMYDSDRTGTGQFMGVYNYGSIGYASGSNTSYGGCLSDFRIYATALSSEDVYNLYAVGASLSDTGVLFSNEVSEV